MKAFKKHERGSVLLYVAGSLVVMMLFIGLAIDGGWTTYVRNQGQAAVDAAALSAVSAGSELKKKGRAPTPARSGAAPVPKTASPGRADKEMGATPPPPPAEKKY